MLPKNKNILLITLAVFATAVINYYIVSLNYAGYASRFMPDKMPPKALFDILWLVAYVFFALGWELACIAKSTNKTRFEEDIQRNFIIVLLINVAMNIAFFLMENYYLASLMNLFLIVALIYLFKKTLTISGRAVLGLIPYLLMALLSFVTLILFIVINSISLY